MTSCLRTPRPRASWAALWLTLLAMGAPLHAQTTAPARPAAAPNPVIVSGTVPDEATRNAILARVRELYGADRVVDQLGVGAVAAPPDWTGYVQKMLGPQLKQISHGQISIHGNNVELKGDVASEDERLKQAAQLTAVLNPTYAVRNGLRAATPDQGLLDATLANRIIEFEPGSSVLRPAGLGILNEMAAALRKLGNKKVEVIGHTDADGPREANIALSRARAEAVRTYLGSQGIAPAMISTTGLGPDQPVAPNNTPDGRARNRRIEFKLAP
jgi:OOP family OmpA-OmpF porin